MPLTRKVWHTNTICALCDQKKKERKDLLGVLVIGIEKLEICNN